MFILREGEARTTMMYCGTSSTLTAGCVGVFDVSTGAAVSKVIDSTSSLLGCNLAGIVYRTPAATDSYVEVQVPVPGQIWEYDCTSNTADGQLGKLNDLTDSTTVANSTTISTAATAFVRNLRAVGAAADKKMLGFIIGAQSPKALS